MKKEEIRPGRKYKMDNGEVWEVYEIVYSRIKPPYVNFSYLSIASDAKGKRFDGSVPLEEFAERVLCKIE